MSGVEGELLLRRRAEAELHARVYRQRSRRRADGVPLCGRGSARRERSWRAGGGFEGAPEDSRKAGQPTKGILKVEGDKGLERK